MTDPITQTVTIEAKLPAGPMVLLDAPFLQTLAKVEREIAHLQITDVATQQQAANLLTRLTGAGTALEKARTDLKQPLLAAGKAIDEAAKGTATRINDAKRSLSGRIVAYDLAQRKKAEEAKAAPKPKARVVDLNGEWDAAPVTVATKPEPKPEGVNFRTYLRFEVVDINKLPPLYVVRSADEKAIRAQYVAGWKDGQPLPECPGVVFSVDRIAVSKGEVI